MSGMPGFWRRRKQRIRYRTSRPDPVRFERLADWETPGEAEVDLPRLLVVAGVMLALFGLLVSRIWFLQVVRGAYYRDRAELNQLRRTRSIPPRGDIVDRNGVVLATNSARFAVYVVPAQLPKLPGKSDKEKQQVVHPVLVRLAKLIGQRPEVLAETLQRNAGPAAEPALVATPITQTSVSRIAENMDSLPGVSVQMEPVRRYPLVGTAGHLLGYTQPVSQTDLEIPDIRRRYRNTDWIGRSGLERSYDVLLSGTPGENSYEVDRKGSGLRMVSSVEPRPGATLQLTLDVRLQQVAESALGNRKGAAVVLDPRSGDVLVLASTPTYDPNLWSVRPLPRPLYESRIRPFATNQALQSQLPPGSTMKIVTAVAGLESGKLGAYTSVQCDGGLRLGKRARLGCTGYHRVTSLYPAFASSCNAFFGQAGIWIGQESLSKWASAFGLGERTGIDVPGEQDGNVDGPRTQEAIYRRFGQEWTGWHHGDSANMAIGQGGMLVTPLQMAVAVAAMGNGGRRVVPRLVRSAILPDGKSWRSPVKPSVALGLSDRTRQMVEQAMVGVVESANGTATSARIPGIEIRGKTGSAESRGKRSPTHAWFVCTAGKPGQPPELAVAVWIDAGGKQLHGGSHAAPVARKLIAKYFGVPDTGSLVAGSVAD